VTDRPVRSEKIDINPVADGYVVYDSGGDMVHYLNHTASMVLELCTGQQTIPQIAALLAQVFTDVPDVPATVEHCVSQLRGLRLVQPAEPAGATAVASIPAQAQAPGDRAPAGT
jgi:Coenzyme PQQ synthesis protein D (PqqD)